MARVVKPLYRPRYVPSGREIAVIDTARGTIRVELFGKEAPGTVGNFIELASKGFYDKLNFYGKVNGDVVVGGCPTTRPLSPQQVRMAVREELRGVHPGMKDCGYRIRDEWASNPRNRHEDGTLSLAHRNAQDSGSCQFFFSLSSHPEYDERFVVFGRTIEGLDVVHRLGIGDLITSVRIEGAHDLPADDELSNKPQLKRQKMKRSPARKPSAGRPFPQPNGRRSPARPVRRSSTTSCKTRRHRYGRCAACWPNALYCDRRGHAARIKARRPQSAERAASALPGHPRHAALPRPARLPVKQDGEREGGASELDFVHHLEHVFALNDDLHSQVFTNTLKPLLHVVEVGFLEIERREHRHGEDAVEDGLADVVDVRAALGKRRGDRGHDAAAIFAQNGDYALHVGPFDLLQTRLLRRSRFALHILPHHERMFHVKHLKGTKRPMRTRRGIRSRTRLRTALPRLAQQPLLSLSRLSRPYRPAAPAAQPPSPPFPPSRLPS